MFTFLALGVVYGVEPMKWLTSHTPILSGLKNSRMLLIANFGLAALAGLGLSALQRESRFPARTRVVALCLLGAGSLVSFLLVYNLQLSTGLKAAFMRSPSFSGNLLFAGLVPIVLRLFGILRGAWFPVLACGLAAFDLLTFSHGYTGFTKPHEIFPPTPAFEFLARQGDPAPFPHRADWRPVP